MAAITKRAQIAKASLYDIGYEYLRDNFHKFNQRNKIRVAVSILQIFEKDDTKTKIPTEIKVVFEKDSVENRIQAPRFAAPSLQ